MSRRKMRIVIASPVGKCIVKCSGAIISIKQRRPTTKLIAAVMGRRRGVYNIPQILDRQIR